LLEKDTPEFIPRYGRLRKCTAFSTAEARALFSSDILQEEETRTVANLRGLKDAIRRKRNNIDDEKKNTRVHAMEKVQWQNKTED